MKLLKRTSDSFEEQVSKQKDNRVFKKIRHLRFKLNRLNDKFPVYAIVGILLIILAISLVVFSFEKHFNETVSESGVNIEGVGDTLWWAIVTLTTVGYGDRFPVSGMGRALTIFMMTLGIIFTAIISGAIVSYFVDRRLREFQGLKEVKVKGHIVICGWNDKVEKIIEFLSKTAEYEYTIVLVNELNEDDCQQLKERHNKIDLKFVRGNFTNEIIIKRSNIKEASLAIVVSDNSAPGLSSEKNKDDRTILGVLAIKSLAPEVKVFAQVQLSENMEHVKRANADEIIVDGEFTGSLLSNAILSPGIPDLVRELLNMDIGSNLLQVPIPKSYVNKTFEDLFEYFWKKEKALVIGVLTLEKDFSLDDLLGGEAGSAIDQFIMKKFAQSQEDYFDQDKKEYQIKINPGSDYVITDQDHAFIISHASKK